MSHEVLIIEDERAIREELADFLREEGFSCVLAATGQEGIERVDGRDFEAILLDIRLPDMTGIEVLERLRDVTPESHVLIMTAHPSVDTVVAALRLGAVDYVTKPLILEELLQKIRRLIEFRAQQMEIQWYRHQLQTEYDFAKIVGKSARMKEVYRLVERVAATDSPVLITGESGTGKELIASAIHHNGPRKDGRFVPLNCAGIPAAVLESQMFGHVKGAFAGADTRAEGLFLAASGGTLFLDEIGDLPLELQPKLLRAVEQQSVLPVGATEPVKVDTRIIATTHVDLQQAIKDGRFREDLFFRLAVFSIEIPPLRERIEDIPAIVDHFIARLNRKLRRHIRGVTNDAQRRLLRYKWKGNVRELQNVIERAIILEDGNLITSAVLPSNLLQGTHPKEEAGPLKEAVREFEREYIGRILHATKGDKRLAAELLGVSVSSIYRRLQLFEEDAGLQQEPIGEEATQE
ncbi:MAG: sigma-54-dependent Fis family transcriptional regulator [Planctomycetes bacterium]|nr:sigma-54-dependent Fis family transcriptional regulator [Planctomycetota bacterium]